MNWKELFLLDLKQNLEERQLRKKIFTKLKASKISSEQLKLIRREFLCVCVF